MEVPDQVPMAIQYRASDPFWNVELLLLINCWWKLKPVVETPVRLTIPKELTELLLGF